MQQFNPSQCLAAVSPTYMWTLLAHYQSPRMVTLTFSPSWTGQHDGQRPFHHFLNRCPDQRVDIEIWRARHTDVRPWGSVYLCHLGHPHHQAKDPPHHHHRLSPPGKRFSGAIPFHRQLKDLLRARLAATDWPQHLPWVLLGLRAAPKGDSSLSSAELVYGPLSASLERCCPHQIHLPSPSCRTSTWRPHRR